MTESKDFEPGAVVMWQVGWPGPDMDYALVLKNLEPGKHRIRFKVYGHGDWKEADTTAPLYRAGPPECKNDREIRYLLRAEWNRVCAKYISKEMAIEHLAEELQFKTEHLDPGEGDWDDLTDREKEFYRQLVNWLLVRHDVLLVAMGADNLASPWGYWRPFSTAPKDGSRFLADSPLYGVVILHWGESEPDVGPPTLAWVTDSEGPNPDNTEVTDAIGWMPLPESSPRPG
jgi:hypothetical protein